jgi:tetrahydromethanopterin S-methyltransferase subunit G
LLEQAKAIKGDIGIIYALVVGEDGNPTVLSYTSKKIVEI